MHILIISDVHANLAALEAVLLAAGKFDAVWCLGDVVGYGPDPNECVARLRELPGLVCLQGNHDAAAIGDLPLFSFNQEARNSIEWLRGVLTEDSLVFLRSLQVRQEEGDFTLVHASPRQPVLEYLLDTHAAGENFDFFETAYCLVGHTHIPVIFSRPSTQFVVDLNVPKANTVTALEPRAIINPGSVGQPRDRDPRAAFAILDTEKKLWDYRRVPYDIPAVQQRMRAAGLPERHSTRLELGW
jgi:diadenosine tetraphosphatase ApaH/serine/threonine PP2A family protein phosphatase